MFSPITYNIHWPRWDFISNSNMMTLILLYVLQLWRMTDLLYRPKDEVLAELQKFKDHVIECSKTTTTTATTTGS